MLKLLIKILFPHCSDTQHRTVRYTFSLVFATLIFASVASVISNEESHISIITGDTNVTEDQTFTIDVVAYAQTPINAIDVTIAYPNDRMVVDSIDTGTSVITLWAEKPHAESGQIFLRGGTFRKGFIGNHTIARIRAHAIKTGEARILVGSTQFVAGDGKGTFITPSYTKNNTIKIAVSGTDGLLTAKATVSVVTDTDGDGDVDVRDIAHFMNAWIMHGQTYDFDKDGKMTFKDFSILLSATFLD